MGKECGVERAYNNLFGKDEMGRKLSKTIREYYRKHQGIDWHSSVLLPRKSCIDLLDPRREIRKKIPDLEHGIDFTMIWTMFCWGESKGIYDFDSDLAEELNHPRSTMLLTEDMFLHSPEAFIVLHLPNLLPKVDSVFFLLSQEGEHKEIYIVFMELDTTINDAGEENISYVGLRIYRDPMTARAIWEKTRSESNTRDAEDENSLRIMTMKALMEMNARAAILPKDFEALSMKVVMDKLTKDEMSDIVGINMESMVQKVLPYYLYICSENADIICTQSEKQRKKNPEILPHYRVGQNVGRVLRKHK